MTWDSYVCPWCGSKATMGIMSVIAHCPTCSAVYIMDSANDRTGWYATVESYQIGDLPRPRVVVE